MKILLVEDDGDKREQLNVFLVHHVSVDIIAAKSLQGAIRSLVSERFDLIVLDMSMTTFDISPTESGGRPQPFAGREVLLQMKRRLINTPVIIVTQYDKFGYGDEETTLQELDLGLKKSFPDIYLGSVPYSVTFSGWQVGLLDILKKNRIIK